MNIRTCIATGWFILGIATTAVGLDSAPPLSMQDQLWRLAEQEQTIYQQDHQLFNDETLNRFMKKVGDKLWRHVTSDLPPPRINIVVDPQPQAVTYADGGCYLTTGMLGVIQNVDQLAMVLAHEFVHYIRQHTVELYLLSAGTIHNTNLQPIKDNIVVDQIIQNAEHQADEEGLQLSIMAGYCPAKALELLSHFIIIAQSKGQISKTDQLINRKTYFEHLLNQLPQKTNCLQNRTDAPNNYAHVTAPILLANARKAIQTGDLNQADADVSRYLVLNPMDANAFFLKGKILNERPGNPNPVESIAYFEKAIELDPGLSSAHKALGVFHFKAGRYAKAKPYFETLINLAPQDASIEYIKGYLRICQK